MSEPNDRSPEFTPDGRYVVVDGRRWRASDPSIPNTLAEQLVGELMAARRAVGASVRAADQEAEAAARRRVGDAKVALGERGDPWWDPTPAGVRRRSAAATRTLLRRRADEASICPSEVARILGGTATPELMTTVRDVVSELAADEIVVATSGPRVVDARTATGPIRIRRGARFDETSP